MYSGEDRTPNENPYAAPMSEAMDSPAVADESLQQRYLRAFVGPKADYYLKKWSLAIERDGASTGGNWAAFFLAGIWLGYRKMYAVTLIFFAIILVESIAEEVIFVVILGDEENAAVVSGIVGLLAAIVCGSYGNRWYLSHARKVIAEVRAQGFGEQAVMEELARRGGTSLGSALGLFLLFILVTFAVFIALGLTLALLEGLAGFSTGAAAGAVG